MCLGLPGEVMEIWPDPQTGLNMAKVAFGSITQEICLTLVDAKPGEFIIAHAGFAITKLDQEASQKTLSAFKEIEKINEIR